MLIQLIVAGIVLGCIYSIVALGYSLIYKASGLISFMQGDIMTLGAYLGMTFLASYNMTFLLAILNVCVVMFIFGFLIEGGVIRRLIGRGIEPIYVVLATIAISYIIQNGSQAIWGPNLRTFPDIFAISAITMFGRAFQTEYVFGVGVSLTLMVVFQFFIRHTRFGIAMQASASDKMAAKTCGINVNLCTAYAWAISAFTAAVAGIIMAPINGLMPTLGSNIGTKGFAAAVIGGYGNMYGAVVGGLILGVLEFLVAGYISSAYKNIVSFTILILFLFVKPYGLFNARDLKR